MIVLEGREKGETREPAYPDEDSGISVGREWRLVFTPVRGEPFEITAARLSDFGSSGDNRISTFAGQVRYHTTFELSTTDWDFLDLGVETHITEVILNGQCIGTKWWGRHLYSLEEGILKPGSNELEIIYTTTLANYVNSLKDNEVAKQWINLAEPDAMGLTQGVSLLKKVGK